MSDESWRTANFRQSVVNKINEAIVQSGMTSSKNSQEMENHVFQKSHTKDEYLSYVARLILHVREMNKAKNTPNQVQDGNNSQQVQQQQQQQQQSQQGPQQGGGGGMMQDPINALQNLASQGTRMPQPSQGMVQGGPGGLLQTLNQPRPMQNMAGMPGMQQRGMVPQQMMPQMSGGNMTMGMGGQMGPNQGQMGMGGQMGPMQGGPMQGGPMQGGPMQGGPMQGGPMQGGPMQGGPMQNNSMQMQMQLQNQMMGGPGGMNPMAIRQGSPNVMNQGPPQMMANQMQGQPGAAAMQAAMNQPGGPGGMPGAQMNPQMNQMMMNRMAQRPNDMIGAQAVASPLQGMPSPALVPSPNPQIPPGMMGPVRGQMPGMMAPSPSQPLNTPGQPIRSGEAPSPLNAHDEQIYREKYRQLTKYIEPLKKMIAKIGDQDENRLLKLKRLLEILSNPNSRIPLETLLKCETALENQLPGLKDQTINNPLLEAVSFNLQTPLAAHTLQRSFRPCLESLYGPDVRNIPLPVRKATTDDDDEVVSHILKREIAGLDRKFKVNLDPTIANDSKTIRLTCWLDDKFLPCVPPINVIIPEDYPFSSPECNILEQEYGTSEFLQAVQAALTARVSSLPKQFSLSHLLDTWEMSVRQACAPKQVTPSPMSVAMNV